MIKFGPSGNSASFEAEGHTKTEEAAAWLKGRGLNAYEYSFGRGVRLGEEKARVIGEAMRENDVEISIHAPYYINFANEDDEMAAKSYGYVLDSAKALRFMGGERCVFHPAAQGKLERGRAVELTADRLKILRDHIYMNGYDDMIFCPETMGKTAQIGGIEEITELCKTDKIYLPCVDFGHINARTMGGLKTKDDYRRVIDCMAEGLGGERIKHFHVHFSKIQYGPKGELRHLTFEDDKYGPEFEPLAEILREYGLEPVIISESAGTQAEDAAAMKNIYENLTNRI